MTTSIIDDREALVHHLRRLVRLQREFIEVKLGIECRQEMSAFIAGRSVSADGELGIKEKQGG